MESAERFAGDLNENYELIMRAWPHANALRNVLAGNIVDYAAALHGSFSIIEIGSGAGESTSIILETLHFKGLLERTKFTSVELDPVLAAKQKKSLQSFIQKGVLEVIVADAFSYLKVSPAEVYNIFTSTWTLHNFNADLRLPLLVDIYRIMKSNGLFAVMDKYVPDEPDEEKRTFAEQLGSFHVYKSAGRKDLQSIMKAHEIEDRAPEYIMRTQETFKVMQQIGFSNCNLLIRARRDGVVTALKRKV